MKIADTGSGCQLLSIGKPVDESSEDRTRALPEKVLSYKRLPAAFLLFPAVADSKSPADSLAVSLTVRYVMES
jgi:hypothetical protein